MSADLRLAWLLVRGSGRGEWWRITLTALGAAVATGLALAAVTLASLRGQYGIPFAHGLLNQPGQRAGVIVALLLLLIPVFGFLGQCARIGAVHRDRRLAALRLAGATPWQVRRIAAAETGPACLVGSALATLSSVLWLLVAWGRPTALAVAGIAVVALAVPAVGALVSVLALRRVVASPLGRVRRIRPRSRPGVLLLSTALAVVAVAVASWLLLSDQQPQRGARVSVPLLMFVVLIVTGTCALWLVGATARVTGRLLAARTDRPALLIAAERLRDDPWAAARTHAALLLVTMVGTAFVGIRRALLEILRSDRHRHLDEEGLAFYTTGIDLTAAAIGVALVIALSALAVGTAESLATRRLALAAQAAAGVPRPVLGRALLLESALPLAPAILLAGAGGMAIGTWYAGVAGTSVPWPALLVPVAVYAVCLLAAATALPLLGRSVRPGELRYA
ncbi:FtsX-like permease family protein [Streptomyces cadmiisoli]|uniref:ABC transporter permease n=1 Tax=Streptomyces cadmiisoli TaxID=2184053 RepID=A0A2Z4J2X5_9ACTN|nr:FtsX-like permease family protein [Streptomyces cadmiisoli]AWW39545.1 ABC transporter permease [Streptomyces cadmiisoli]